MAMFALATFRTRGGVAVTAFHLATSLSTRTASASSRTFGTSGTVTRPRSAFHRRVTGSSPAVSDLKLQMSTLAVSADLEKKMDVKHPAYEIITKDYIDEYGAATTLYRHKKSGAELLSVSTDDDNKVFGITFRTPPEDSTGVPHILEHSVLCGSRKYTTKDPFVQLLQGSLQTFLNAFTYPDRTCYVVASQNDKDFYNLISVYSDAVFHPRAISDPMVHAQEGWHLELEKKEDPLIFKGVVFNEMKGVYSSPDSLLNRESQRSIFPDNTYGVDSGGDPRVIPDLSFEQFVDFHKKFYHPSNSRIYFSGDDDVFTRLEIMDEYLREFDYSPESKPGSVIQWQKKMYTEPKKEVHPYPIGEDQPETHMMMVNWLMNDKPLSPFEELTLGIMDHLLTGTSSSILRKTLMESGYGEAITGGGLSDELLQATFSIGMKGVKPDDVDKLEKLILETLEKVAEEGFEADDIASSMNTIEFSLREFNTGSFPKGLSFMLGAMSKWLYDESPTAGLKFEEPLQQLKSCIAESGSQVFQNMIKEMLVSNSHRTTIEMVPSKTYESELLKEEQDRLEKIKASLSDQEIENIIETTKKLKELQASEDSPEDRATIPKLQLGDLKRESTEYPIEVTENESNSGVTILRHELGSTSGIAYVVLGVDLSALPVEDIALLPLFTRVMMETGAGEFDQVALSRRIGTYTGGIDVSVLTTAVHPKGAMESAVLDGNHLQTKLIMKGKATSDKTDELFSLMRLILTEARFDSKNRIIEILKEDKARMESRIRGSGHQAINMRMKARYRVGGYIDEMMGGITQLDTIRELLKQAEEDWPSLLSRLEKMRSAILDHETCRDGMLLDITGDKAVLEKIQPSVDIFLMELPGASDGRKLPDFYSEVHPWVAPIKKLMSEMAPVEDEGFVVPTQVSYVGKGGILYEEGETATGAAQVVSKFLRTGYLWDYVRVMGGAYGGFCTFSPYSGFFSYLSYRDPNLSKTLDIYDAAGDAVIAAAEQMENDPEILSQAIIGTIGEMDGALSPNQKGFTQMQRWLVNESAEYRQNFRNQILDTKPADFKAFGERLKSIKDPSTAVISSQSAFEAAKADGKEFKLKTVL
ncbi:peptidase M16C family-associated protein [Nitzschia inconspicua]|uniref:Peptidase M16C family-associated protein n=1 Tax=Nitzschia inconspicua TaxID=303405 RepID=A0A9K3PQL0_9STRA|nr:peptidase M16C family-associated protein [Nitzschia inconspicua]